MDSRPLFRAGERFEVRRRLGEGGMGVVYEAYDRELQQLVALKTLRHADARLLGRFKREFRSLHDIAHRNIVALGEFFDGDAESEPFFTMELLRGVNFLAYVRGPAAAPPDHGDSSQTARTAQLVIPRGRPGPALGATAAAAAGSGSLLAAPRVYDEARLRAALGQLVVGLATLHRTGKVHRDIKPQNILVTHEGRVVLLDFGLAAPTEGAQQSTDGRIVGTAAYMAPEQAMVGEVTPAVDWYSLGVLLFEALTGILPYTGRTPYEIILDKQQRLALPPSQIVDAVPRDLDALCRKLLQPDPAHRPDAHEIFARLCLETKPATERPSRRLRAATRQPFVGRVDELRRLQAGYERSRTGPHICLVEGVSGVGKTQLVQEFVEQLATRDASAVVLAGRCYEREVVPYKAFDGLADALSRYLEALPPVQVAELMPRRPALLGRLFPVLKRLEPIAAAGVLADVSDPHDQRQRMFASLRELFLRLTEKQRLVWFIDDLHWTDADSLVLLSDLLAHEDRLPVLVIATVRPVVDAPRKALLDKVAALAPTERIDLDELTPGEAREFAGLLLPDRQAATLDALARGAGGHPMLLQELARHVEARAAGAAGANLDVMLAERIGQLAEAAQTLLQVVSVFGGPLGHEVAAIAAQLSSADQVRAADILRAAHLVRTDGVRRSDRIVVYHDRVREHVCARLDATRLARLHERLALALEQTGAAEHNPRALVRHARAAGKRALAATYALSAARHAVGALAFDQAAEFLATALELGSHDEATLRHLRIELATALMHAGRGPEAAASFMAAAEGAEPAVRLDCQRHAADQWIITGHLDQGLGALSSSLADIGEPLAASPRRALARVVSNRVRLRLRGIGHVKRLESQVPVEILRRLDVLKAVAHGLAMVDNIRGADFNGRFLLLALRTGEPRRLLAAMATEVLFLASQGGRAGRRARQLYAELVRLAAHCPDEAFARTWLLGADGVASFFEGRFTAAVEALERAETIFAEGAQGLTYERNNARVFRIHALRLLGQLERQGAQIAELVRSGEQRGDQYLVTTLGLLECLPLLARGDVRAARQSVEGATWSPPEQGFHLQHWNELRSCADLALYEGSAAEAAVALAPRFAELHRSMLLRVQIVRADAVSLRGRLLLAAATAGPMPAGGRAEVLGIARQLEGEKIAYASLYALLLRAGLCALDARGATGNEGATGDTVAYLRRAIDLAAAHDLALHLAAARHRLGAILGGDEGAGLTAAAARYAQAEAIVDPARMFEIVAPGFDTPRGA